MKRFKMSFALVAPLAAITLGAACGGCAMEFDPTPKKAPAAKAAASQGPAAQQAAAAVPAAARQQATLASDVQSPRSGIATWQGVADLRQDIMRSKAQINSAVDSLNQLNAQGGGDLRPAYDEFDRELVSTELQSQKMRLRSETMRNRGRDHFRSWQEQSLMISDPTIRTQAEQRLAAVRADFQRIVASMQDARDSFGPLMSGLVDIRRYLSTDLTPRGVGAIGPAVRKANEDAAAVQKRLDAVVAELDRAAAELLPGTESNVAQSSGQAAPAAAAVPATGGGPAGASGAQAGTPADPANK
jgi:hypothetical protein